MTTISLRPLSFVNPQFASQERALRVHRSVEQAIFELKASDSRREREEALRLVHRVYRQHGLADGNEAGLRVMRQHLCDDSSIFVVREFGRVVFTVTLVGDSEYGMPLESLFGDEVDSMRKQGIRLAEVSCLAHDSSITNSRARFSTLVQGISLLIQAARLRGVDRLLLAVHPRHAKVYERLFGCVMCSQTKTYEAVRGNPAILCMHDFAALDETKYPLYRQVYDPEYGIEQLLGKKMSEAEKLYFEQFLPAGEYELVPMAA